MTAANLLQLGVFFDPSNAINAITSNLLRKMHLWPSMRLRDSFKNNYLKKLEWNLSRMNDENQQANRSDGNQQKLLETDENGSEKSAFGGIGLICREVLMILSCCYCCFCCGACIEDDEESS